MGSGVVAPGLSRSSVYAILPDQGFNLCLLHWQRDSSPMSHQGSPLCFLSFPFFLILFNSPRSLRIWLLLTSTSLPGAMGNSSVILDSFLGKWHLVASKLKFKRVCIQKCVINSDKFALWIFLWQSRQSGCKEEEPIKVSLMKMGNFGRIQSCFVWLTSRSAGGPQGALAPGAGQWWPGAPLSISQGREVSRRFLQAGTFSCHSLQTAFFCFSVHTDRWLWIYKLHK